MKNKLMKYCLVSCVLLGFASSTFAAPAFTASGSTVVIDNVKASRLFVGINNTYVTFSGNTLPGCRGNGGYVTSTWAEASGGTADPMHAGLLVSGFLTAKAHGYSMEVRYRVNSQGTGWSDCAIDNIYLH